MIRPHPLQQFAMNFGRRLGHHMGNPRLLQIQSCDNAFLQVIANGHNHRIKLKNPRFLEGKRFG